VSDRQDQQPTQLDRIEAKLDRITDLLEHREAKRQPADGVYRVRIPESSRIAEYWVQRQIAEEWAVDEGLEAPPVPEPTRYAAGGLIEAPKDGLPLIGRPGCNVAGYCPTHDGRVIAIRDGRPKDVTDEAIAARLPREEGGHIGKPKRRPTGAVPARCDICPADAAWNLNGSRYCERHAPREGEAK
jgi:hypothetical protein